MPMVNLTAGPQEIKIRHGKRYVLSVLSGDPLTVEVYNKGTGVWRAAKGSPVAASDDDVDMVNIGDSAKMRFTSAGATEFGYQYF